MKNLVKNKHFWLLICIGLALISGIGYAATYYTFFAVGMLVSLVYPLILGLTMAVYAWIVHPIKWIIQKIKEKKE